MVTQHRAKVSSERTCRFDPYHFRDLTESNFMDTLILKTTDSILESVVSAFDTIGFKSQTTTKLTKADFGRGTSYYFSLKREKRTLRFTILLNKSFWLHIRECSKNVLTTRIVVVGDTIVIDVKGINDKLAEMDKEALEIIEGRKLQAFKMQLIMPYIQGRIEGLGYHITKSTNDGKKGILFDFKEDIKLSEKFTLLSIPVKYEKLNKMENFDDLPFKLFNGVNSWNTIPIFEGTLGEAFTVVSSYKEVTSEVKQDIQEAAKVYRELQSQITALQDKARPFLKIINSEMNMKISKLKEIAKATKDKPC